MNPINLPLNYFNHIQNLNRQNTVIINCSYPASDLVTNHKERKIYQSTSKQKFYFGFDSDNDIDIIVSISSLCARSRREY